VCTVCVYCQELLISYPQLVSSGVVDLSAGGALPLHLAAAGGHLDVVRALLAAGAPLEATEGKGQTALQVRHTAETGHFGVSRLQCTNHCKLLLLTSSDQQSRMQSPKGAASRGA